MRHYYVARVVAVVCSGMQYGAWALARCVVDCIHAAHKNAYCTGGSPIAWGGCMRCIVPHA